MKKAVVRVVTLVVLAATSAYGQETARILDDGTNQWFFAQFSVDADNWQSDVGGYCGEGGFTFDVPEEGTILTITTYHNYAANVTKQVSTLDSSRGYGDLAWVLAGYSINGPRLSAMTAYLPGQDYDRGSVKVRFHLGSRKTNIAVRLQIDSTRPLRNFEQIDPRYITSPTTGCEIPDGIFYSSPQ